MLDDCMTKGIEPLKNYNTAIWLLALETWTALRIWQPQVSSHFVAILVNCHLRTASAEGTKTILRYVQLKGLVIRFST